jgi:UDP-N-acetylglucosamine 2-epimerase (non-hydrolysing)
MEGFEPVLLERRPSWVVVVGDVNSTLACALVAAKLRQDIGCRIAHVEAGLRSNDWEMPEEVNRVLTDRLADLLLTPSRDVDANLAHEGLTDTAVAFVGNVMIDALMGVLPRARELDMPGRFGVAAGDYLVVTLHRPSNVDDPEQLTSILDALAAIAAHRPVVFPMHPRTRKRIDAAGGRLSVAASRILVTEPLGYAEMVGLMDASAAVLTDSGGLQEESTVLGVPCVTLRAQTERPITVTEGTNRMATWPPSTESILSDVATAVAAGRVGVGSRAPEGWDGRAAARIVDALVAD